jgi:hypothetical protein
MSTTPGGTADGLAGITATTITMAGLLEPGFTAGHTTTEVGITEVTADTGMVLPGTMTMIMPMRRSPLPCKAL